MERNNPFSYLGELLDQQLSSDTDHSEYITQSNNSIFDEIPVKLDVFLYDKRFMALPQLSQKQFDFIEAGTQIYYLDTLNNLRWQFGNYYTMLVAKWGKGSGKDTVARIILSRIAYQLLCLKDPQKYLNMVAGDKINMLNVAYSAAQAQGVFFEPLKFMLERPGNWFKDKIDPTENIIRFGKQINLVSGHSDTEGLEGNNLIAAVLDEISAFKTKAELALRQRRSLRALEHSAEHISNMVTSSAISRFPYIYKIIYISYTRFKGDFIEQKFDEGLQIPKTAFVSFGATWDVNPTKKREMFNEEYTRNPENAKAMYECDPPKAIDQYFKELTPELKAFAFPVKLLSDLPLLPDDFNFVLQDWFRGIPGVSYFVHVDIGISNNRAGLCVSHRAGFIEKEVERFLPDGFVRKEIIRLPKVHTDIWGSIRAVPGKEISLEGIREFLLDLHEKRDMRLHTVTYDGFQSVDSIQLLTKRGILADKLSIDRDCKAYDTLKEIMYSRRLKAYHRDIGIDELERLNIVTGSKVDHPLTGSKDEADALAGSVYNAVNADISDATESDLMSGSPYNEMFANVNKFWTGTGEKSIAGIWTPDVAAGKVRY